MTTDTIRFEIFDRVLDLPPSKVKTNAIRIAFGRLASDWLGKINDHFLDLFPKLDDLYSNGGSLANEVRAECIDAALKILASYGIYDVSDQQFFEQFMSHYDGWDDEFEHVLNQYEEIVERTAELDAYRTARRQNRRKWIGYGSREAVRSADYENAFNNVAHGAFNLVAKGITAIGNMLKKEEILKDPATKVHVSDGLESILIAGFHATVDAVNAHNDDTLYRYSQEEMAKAAAIVENIGKGRIPSSEIRSTLIRGLETYPYERDIYVLLLTHFGNDKSRLDELVEFFGLESLSISKKDIFEARRRGVDLTSLASCKANLPQLLEYAELLGHESFASESQELLRSAQKKAFDAKARAHDLSTVDACKKQFPALVDYAKSIDYQGFHEDLKQLLGAAIQAEFLRESSKYKLLTVEDCEASLPGLSEFAKKIGYKGFDSWSADVKKKRWTMPSWPEMLRRERRRGVR